MVYILTNLSSMKLFRNTSSTALIVGLFFVICSQSAVNQDLSAASTDTAIVIPETIALADISIASGEDFITTKKIVESLITYEQLDQIQINTDSILSRIDSLLNIEANVDFSSTNIRFLDNRQMYWYDKQKE